METGQRPKGWRDEMTSMCPLYEVTADRETGEWIGEPADTGEVVGFSEWCARKDTDAEHYDHYEASWTDADDVRHEEVRAIRVLWA